MTKEFFFDINGVAGDIPFTEVKSKALLTLTWSDGDMYTGASTRRPIFSDEERAKIRFYRNEIITGHYAVTYQDRIVYEYGNGRIPVSQGSAMGIKRGIADGYKVRWPDCYSDHELVRPAHAGMILPNP